jgi:hypothetical protein
MANSHAAFHAAFLAAMDRLEGGLKADIQTDKAQFIHAASKRYAEHGTINFFDLVHKHQDQVFTTLKKHYKTIIPAFGTLSLGQVKSRSFKAADESALFEDLTQQWIHTEGLKRSKLIADTTEADVLKAISDGVADELGTAAIASAISDVSELSGWRSEMIARTEVHAAANYGSIESVRSAEERLGVEMLKSWLPTMDGRTRPAHADMAGADPIPTDDKFDVEGEEMDRPGDPAGSPDNVINCRCVLGYEEAGRQR